MEPKIGDSIYIWSGDDWTGGLATIHTIETKPSGTVMVGVYEVHGLTMNWSMLVDEQKKLKREYGTRIAHRDSAPQCPNCGHWIVPK